MYMYTDECVCVCVCVCAVVRNGSHLVRASLPSRKMAWMYQGSRSRAAARHIAAQTRHRPLQLLVRTRGSDLCGGRLRSSSVLSSVLSRAATCATASAACSSANCVALAALACGDWWWRWRQRVLLLLDAGLALGYTCASASHDFASMSQWCTSLSSLLCCRALALAAEPPWPAAPAAPCPQSEPHPSLLCLISIDCFQQHQRRVGGSVGVIARDSALLLQVKRLLLERLRWCCCCY